MTRGTARNFLACMGAGLLLAFLLVQQWPVDSRQQDRFLGDIQRIRQLDSEINRDLLSSRYELLGSYDPFVHQLEELRKTEAELQVALPVLRAQNREKFERLLRTAAQLLSRKAHLVERFKSDNAVFKNSIRYFPALIAECSLAATVAKDSKLQERLASLLRDILLYDLAPNFDLTNRLHAEVALIGDVKARGPRVAAALGSVRAHAAVIIAAKPQVEDVIQELTLLPFPLSIEAIRRAYSADYEEKSKIAETYRVLLCIYSVVLLGFGIDRGAKALKSRVALEEAKAANSSKSMFLANMSHEMRTPLNGVLGMIDLALGDNDIRGQKREYLETAKTSADTLITIIEDILDLSRIEAGKLALNPVQFHFRNHIARVLKPLALRADVKQLELICDIRPDVPEEIVADADRLSQIINNLIGNAIKFTSTGEVEFRVEVSGSNGVNSNNKGLGLHFSVRDTGIGIPPDRQSSIFEAFSQADNSTSRKFGGTGLGLTISSRLVQLMGGRLWVDSRPELGSIFHYTIQTSMVEAGKTKSTPLETVSLAGIPTLIVDDNATSGRVLAEMVESMGIRPELTSDASKALSRVANAANNQTPFQLILLDSQMAGTDGFALAATLKDMAPFARAAIVMLTKTGERNNSARFRELGAAAAISKPVTRSQLSDAIRLALANDCGAASSTQPNGSRPVHGGLQVQPSSPLRILLAEDNLVNQMVAVGILESQGHAVKVAANGEEALAALHGGTFDLILMDAQMPRMNGFEATQAIREKERATGEHIPIVALTAHAMSGDRERCLSAGMDGYCTKPIRADELFGEIERVRAACQSAAVMRMAS